MEITHWCKITADLVISLALGQLNSLTWDILTISDNTHHGCQGDNIIKSDQSEPEAIRLRDVTRDHITFAACEKWIWLFLNIVEQWRKTSSCSPSPLSASSQLRLNPPVLQVSKGVEGAWVTASPLTIQPLNRGWDQTKLFSSYPYFAHYLVQVRCWM